MHLEYLSLCGNEIFDVSLLANLIHLKGLDLGGNKVSDITPLYDGLAIDGLAHNGLGFVGRHLHPGTDAEIVQGITRILQKIRANVPEDFLIIGNARSKNNLYADYINGDAMEVGPGADGQGATPMNNSNCLMTSCYGMRST